MFDLKRKNRWIRVQIAIMELNVIIMTSHPLFDFISIFTMDNKVNRRYSTLDIIHHLGELAMQFDERFSELNELEKHA